MSRISPDEFYHLQYQLMIIQEQQQYQNYLIEQFEQQIRTFFDKCRSKEENPLNSAATPISTVSEEGKFSLRYAFRRVFFLVERDDRRIRTNQ